MKAAIVGCGCIATVHAQSLEKLENVTLVGLADIKKERADAFAARFGGHAYGSLEEMISCEKPDVIHICTPHYLHVPMAIYGLTYGVNVFMEKPPAISEEQWEQLCEAEKTSEGRIGVCFQNRYNHSIRMAKKLIDSGKAGKIRGARGLVTWSRGAAYYTDSDWRGRLETEGGGALINQSIHTLDLLGYFLGRPTYADARMANHHLQGVIEVEDTIEAFVRYEEADASFYATTAYCDDVPPIIEIACENMTLRIEDVHLTLIHKDGRIEIPELEKSETMGKSYWGSGHAGCIRDFYDCLESGTRFGQDLKGVEDTLKLMLAVYESARAGKGVDLK